MADRTGQPGVAEQMRSEFVAAVLLSVAVGSSAVGAGVEYRVDAANSQATVHVGKAGAFSFIGGHTHTVTTRIENGSIELDPLEPSQSRVSLAIAADGLKVSPTGEPEGDAPKVQAAMESDKVLDVGNHPRITFDSTEVSVTTRRGDVIDVIVTGRLAIRGVTQIVSAPVHIELAGNRLTAAGRFAIKQTAFGIKPISVGGVVSVKDELAIEFSISATSNRQ